MTIFFLTETGFCDINIIFVTEIYFCHGKFFVVSETCSVKTISLACFMRYPEKNFHGKWDFPLSWIIETITLWSPAHCGASGLLRLKNV